MKLILVFALLIAIWWLARNNAARRAPRPDTRGSDEARALLGLDAGASVADVHAAHRRMMGRVHPDAGGSAAMAAQVNAARDLLVAEMSGGRLNTGGSRAS